jgi:hypothetical protein
MLIEGKVPSIVVVLKAQSYEQQEAVARHLFFVHIQPWYLPCELILSENVRFAFT